jgi:hypothetical protein
MFKYVEPKKQSIFSKQILAKPKEQTCSELTDNGELCKNFIWANHPCCYAHRYQYKLKTKKQKLEEQNHFEVSKRSRFTPEESLKTLEEELKEEVN